MQFDLFVAELFSQELSIIRKKFVDEPNMNHEPERILCIQTLLARYGLT
jgi:hypothetical protein